MLGLMLADGREVLTVVPAFGTPREKQVKNVELIMVGRCSALSVALDCPQELSGRC